MAYETGDRVLINIDGSYGEAVLGERFKDMSYPDRDKRKGWLVTEISSMLDGTNYVYDYEVLERIDESGVLPQA